jgi:hypothetical protein
MVDVITIAGAFRRDHIVQQEAGEIEGLGLLFFITNHSLRN